MTIEEITQTLQRVADNQATHSADIAEIDKQIAAVVESQNRHDRQLARLFDVMGDLADKHLKNEERFASLAVGMRRLEGSYELLESFVRSVREETRDYFAETDRKLAVLAGVQARTAEVVAEFVKETNGRFAETDRRQAKTDEQMNRTDDQIKALIAAQTRTDEQIRHLLERNGSSKVKAKKAVKKARKAGKKEDAK